MYQVKEKPPILSFLYLDCLVLKTFYQISGHAVGQVMIATDMHQRKAEMARQADAFIALPGMSYMVQLLTICTKRLLNLPIIS